MIEARQLKKSFGKVTAVEDVSFTAHDGQITGLLGPNGAGKSTTLRMLYTVLTPDSGTAMVDDIDVVQSPTQGRHQLGVFAHNPGVYPNLTARENIRYYGELCGLDESRILRRIDELTDFLDMAEILDRRTKGFSQGQRTKVALARCLIHEPRNVILDEPTNGLDVMSTRALRKLIEKLRDAGMCVVFSSHIMQEVAALCDRIVIINRGRVVAAGTPDEIRAQTGTDNLEDSFVRTIEE
ncbi:MAG: ATP-binding cassette domain-containing protein [Gammaproteobacteria bacterium]